MNIKDKLRFLLQEFSFKDANDVDYVFSDIYATFDENPKYVVLGRTHGLLSHAIKHIQEFSKGAIDKELNEIKKIFEENEDKLTFIHKSKGVIKPVKLEEGVLLNSIDYINDKIKQNASMTGMEKSIQPYLKKISEKYRIIIEEFKKHAVEIKNQSEEDILNLLKNGKTVYYHVKDTSSDVMYINVKESMFMVEDNKGVKTFFRPTLGKTFFIDKVKGNRIRYPQEPENPNFLKALMRV